MEDSVKRLMNEVSNIIIVICLGTLLGMALLKKQESCSCTMFQVSNQRNTVNA